MSEFVTPIWPLKDTVMEDLKPMHEYPPEGTIVHVFEVAYGDIEYLKPQWLYLAYHGEGYAWKTYAESSEIPRKHYRYMKWRSLSKTPTE
jgi:hypothetical protein